MNRLQGELNTNPNARDSASDTTHKAPTPVRSKKRQQAGSFAAGYPPSPVWPVWFVAAHASTPRPTDYADELVSAHHAAHGAPPQARRKSQVINSDASYTYINMQPPAEDPSEAELNATSTVTLKLSHQAPCRSVADTRLGNQSLTTAQTDGISCWSWRGGATQPLQESQGLMRSQVGHTSRLKSPFSDLEDGDEKASNAARKDAYRQVEPSDRPGTGSAGASRDCVGLQTSTACASWTAWATVSHTTNALQSRRRPRRQVAKNDAASTRQTHHHVQVQRLGVEDWTSNTSQSCGFIDPSSTPSHTADKESSAAQQRSSSGLTSHPRQFAVTANICCGRGDPAPTVVDMQQRAASSGTAPPNLDSASNRHTIGSSSMSSYSASVRWHSPMRPITINPPHWRPQHKQTGAFDRPTGRCGPPELCATIASSATSLDADILRTWRVSVSQLIESCPAHVTCGQATPTTPATELTASEQGAVPVAVPKILLSMRGRRIEVEPRSLRCSGQRMDSRDAIGMMGNCRSAARPRKARQPKRKLTVDPQQIQHAILCINDSRLCDVQADACKDSSSRCSPHRSGPADSAFDVCENFDESALAAASINNGSSQRDVPHQASAAPANIRTPHPLSWPEIEDVLSPSILDNLDEDSNWGSLLGESRQSRADGCGVGGDDRRATSTFSMNLVAHGSHHHGHILAEIAPSASSMYGSLPGVTAQRGGSNGTGSSQPGNSNVNNFLSHRLVKQRTKNLKSARSSPRPWPVASSASPASVAQTLHLSDTSSTGASMRGSCTITQTSTLTFSESTDSINASLLPALWSDNISVARLPGSSGSAASNGTTSAIAPRAALQQSLSVDTCTKPALRPPRELNRSISTHRRSPVTVPVRPDIRHAPAHSVPHTAFAATEGSWVDRAIRLASQGMWFKKVRRVHVAIDTVVTLFSTQVGSLVL